MKTQARRFSDAPVLRPRLGVTEMGLVALCMLLTFQIIRIFLPVLFEYGESSGKVVDALKAGVLGLAVFLTPLLAPALDRILGASHSLLVFVLALAGFRVAVQLVHPIPLALAAAGVVIALNALAFLLLAVRSEHAGHGGRVFAVTTFVGLALDTGLRAAFWTWDYSWRTGVVPLVLAAVPAAGVVILLLVRDRFWTAPREEGVRNEVIGISLLGPFLALQVLFLQSVAFVASAGNVSLPLASAIVLVGDALALVVVVTWMLEEFPRPVLWVAGVAMIGVGVMLPRSSGSTVIPLVLVGQLLAAGFVLLALNRPIKLPYPTARTTSSAVALAGGLFMLLVAWYQMQYRVALPVKGTVIPPIAAALLALGVIGGTRPRSMTRPPRAAWTIAIPVALLLVPLGLTLTRADVVAAAGNGKSLRIFDYNVHMAIDGNGQIDPEGIARAIEQASPDVVVLQEVVRGWPGGGSIDLGEWLSNRLRMHQVFAPAADDQFGQLILTRLPIVSSVSADLPMIKGLQRRSYVGVVVDIGGGHRIRIVGTQLEGRKTDHRAQVESLLFALGPNLPTIVAGDMNMQPDSEDVALFEHAGLASAQDVTGNTALSSAKDPNFPGDRPDWIFGTANLTFSNFRIGPASVSDHLPLQVVATLK
ncbi:MAG: endonuclease/exonuclease/phosphatase family protein [Actinomycetota bacterium]